MAESAFKPPGLDYHNLLQRRYFERRRKRTMVPRDTPYLRRHLDEALQFAGIAPGARVLEVGCGMGRYTLPLAQRSLQVEAVDLSPVLLDALRRLDPEGRITLHCLDIIDHPKNMAGRFDAVVGFFTLHHIHDLQRTFTAVARVLRPGGRVVFLEPNPRNLLYYIQILITPGMSWRGERGILRMRRGILLEAMEGAGLRRLSMKRFGFFPPFLANLPGGGRLERALERFPPFRPLLPFQLFAGELPQA